MGRKNDFAEGFIREVKIWKKVMKLRILYWFICNVFIFMKYLARKALF